MPFQPPTCDRLLQSLNGLLEEEDGVFDEKVTVGFAGLMLGNKRVCAE